MGRASTALFLIIAAAWSPFLLHFERVFSYIQEFWGLITPGVAVVFLGGLFWRGATAKAAAWVMGLTLPVTVGVKLLTSDVTLLQAFLNQMWLAGIVLIVLLIAISKMSPEIERAAAAGEASRETTTAALPRRDRLFDALCLGVVGLTLALYVVFF